ncbi:AT-rich interactive domain-containing protein 3C isoform X2 [Monodon monoceros]|uniref:AT-rich interactive domain-containing protein 3C isoform X2 n=1 Tax=Monodon monoceros TaxID=40151 RepID=UPI0010F6E90F|nr:AT-rich interactive domain-containing protein 3C isoform X2 [Monodon monoceros]
MPKRMRKERKLAQKRRQPRRATQGPRAPAHLPASPLDLIPMSGPMRSSSSSCTSSMQTPRGKNFWMTCLASCRRGAAANCSGPKAAAEGDGIGTPVNRVPIMAKQVLDLYALFRLVTAKGGLVEVINRKVWREVTRGLSLPTTITSAAFTLRTQYMKYLYPYECETRALSSPGELQAAIDSNRREGRRQAYTNTPLFGLAGQSPWGTLGPASGSGPAPPAPTPGPRTAQGSASGLPAHACAQLSPSPIKKEESRIPTPRLALPVGLAFGPAREKVAPEEPPEKRAVLMGPMDPPRHGAPPSFLPRGKVPLRGVLFARCQPVPASQGPANSAPPPLMGPPSSASP